MSVDHSAGGGSWSYHVSSAWYGSYLWHAFLSLASLAVAAGGPAVISASRALPRPLDSSRYNSGWRGPPGPVRARSAPHVGACHNGPWSSSLARGVVGALAHLVVMWRDTRGQSGPGRGHPRRTRFPAGDPFDPFVCVDLRSRSLASSGASLRSPSKPLPTASPSRLAIPRLAATPHPAVHIRVCVLFESWAGADELGVAAQLPPLTPNPPTERASHGGPRRPSVLGLRHPQRVASNFRPVHHAASGCTQGQPLQNRRGLSAARPQLRIQVGVALTPSRASARPATCGRL